MWYIFWPLTFEKLILLSSHFPLYHCSFFFLLSAKCLTENWLAELFLYRCNVWLWFTWLNTYKIFFILTTLIKNLLKVLLVNFFSLKLHKSFCPFVIKVWYFSSEKFYFIRDWIRGHILLQFFRASKLLNTKKIYTV